MQNMSFYPFSMDYQAIYYPQTYFYQAPMLISYNWPDHWPIINQSVTYAPLTWPLQTIERPTRITQPQILQFPNNNQAPSLSAIQNVQIFSDCSKRIQNRNDRQQIQAQPKASKISQKLVIRSGVQRFIKKNTQSNIVNQIFSFLWSHQKNNQYLAKILQTPQQQAIYYKILNKIKVHYKKQRNRFYLKKLLTLVNEQLLQTKLKIKIKQLNQFGVNKLAKIMARLTYFYLADDNRRYILTSRKMNKELWTLHLQKSRQLRSFLFDQDTADKETTE